MRDRAGSMAALALALTATSGCGWQFPVPAYHSVQARVRSEAGDRSRIVGTVREVRDGTPVRDAHIQVAPGEAETARATTDENGRFELAVPPGVHEVVFHDPYRIDSYRVPRVVVSPGRTTELAVRLVTPEMETLDTCLEGRVGPIDTRSTALTTRISEERLAIRFPCE